MSNQPFIERVQKIDSSGLGYEDRATAALIATTLEHLEGVYGIGNIPDVDTCLDDYIARVSKGEYD